jgi:NADH:ubiquinone reductase (non-electrogenic)
LLRTFELAALPGTSEEERRRLLHFVVVGGGPTGVEFSGTLSDYVRSDLRRKYPLLMPYVRVSLLQSAQGILTQFDSGLARRALDDLQRTGVEIRTGVRVIQVTDRCA